MNEYLIGSTPTVSALFADEDGAAADPTAVTLTVTAPDSTVTVYNTGQLVNDAVGRWEKEFTVDQVGTWTYSFAGTGAVTATSSGSFSVVASLSPGGLTCDPWVSPVDLSCDVSDVAVAEWACRFASDTLYLFSGRIYPGICTDTVRPCAAIRDPNPGPSMIPGYNGGRGGAYAWGPWAWQLAWGSCSCSLNGSFGCGCGSDQVRLPCEPVTSITQVLEDGVVLDPSTYRLDAPGWLVRLDGKSWRSCQNLLLDSTQPDTFEVTYGFGREVPSVASFHAATLACELIAGQTGGDCQLPKRVTQVIRQGITYMILDPLSLFAEGRTGISAIDMWLGSINPYKVKSASKIWSPRSTARAHRNG